MADSDQVVRAVNPEADEERLYETLAMYEVARAGGLGLMMGGWSRGRSRWRRRRTWRLGWADFSFIDLDTALLSLEATLSQRGGARTSRLAAKRECGAATA